MEDCPFCKIRGGKIPTNIIWEDGNFFAFLEINPLNRGHTLLVPKEHTSSLFEMEAPLMCDFFRTAVKLSSQIKGAVGSERVSLAIQGFSVQHIHIHIIPVNSENKIKLQGNKRNTQGELLKTAKLVRSFINPK